MNRQNPKAGQIAAQLEALKSGTQEQDVIPDRVVVSTVEMLAQVML